MLNYGKHANNKGFTLVELMIVVAIVAIITAIAFPSYQQSSRKTRRADAHALLLGAAQIQERHFTEFGQYGTTIITSGTVDADNVLIDTDSEHRYYTLSSTALTATSFTLTAVPVAGGPQASDSCGTLSLNHLGVKGPSDDCW